MLVLEVFARDRIIIRLAGTKHREILGREITGENFVELAAPSQREHHMASYSNYASYPCGAKWAAGLTRSSGLRTSVRGLALPVGPQAPEDPIRMYAAFDFSGDMKGFETEPLNVIPTAHERTYVDIGCGAPE